MKATAAAMPAALSSNELAFYGAYLRDASRAPGQDRSHRQKILASLLARETDLTDWIGRRDIIALAEASEAKDAPLAHNLRRVARMEALLAPADLVSDFVLMRHGQSPSAVADALRHRWGSQVPNLESPIDELLPEVAELKTSDLAGNFRVLDQALHKG